MAWTDAARQAALATRKAHAAAKGEGREHALGANPLTKQVLTSPTLRKTLAKHLRAFRKGGKAARASMNIGYSLQPRGALDVPLPVEARASTILRNQDRIFGKRLDRFGGRDKKGRR